MLVLLHELQRLLRTLVEGGVSDLSFYMSRGPDDPSDISQRIIKPRQLWLTVFGGVLTLLGLGFPLLIAKLWLWITH